LTGIPGKPRPAVFRPSARIPPQFSALCRGWRPNRHYRRHHAESGATFETPPRASPDSIRADLSTGFLTTNPGLPAVSANPVHCGSIRRAAP